MHMTGTAMKCIVGGGVIKNAKKGVKSIKNIQKLVKTIEKEYEKIKLRKPVIKRK